MVRARQASPAFAIAEVQTFAPFDLARPACDLGRALHDVLDHVERGGWGQPPQVFALVPTRLIAAQNPELVDEGDDSALSPVAQEPLEVAGGEEPYARLEEFLATATWYPPVEGVALILEIVVLPPDAEGDLDSAFEPLLGDPAASESAAREAARAHPSARTARLAVGALRNGKRLSLMRLRPGPDDDPTGPWNCSHIPNSRRHCRRHWQRPSTTAPSAHRLSAATSAVRRVFAAADVVERREC